MKNQAIINNNNFSVYVSEILNNLQQILGNVNRSPKDYKLVINERALKRLGRCTLKTDNNNHSYYEIQINKFHNELSPKQDVINTLVHEIIHSLPNCYNHGVVWKTIATKYNENYYTSISRCSKASKEYNDFLKQKKQNTQNRTIHTIICPSCHKKWNYTRKAKLVQLVLQGKELICPTCGTQSFIYQTNNK